MKRGIEMELSNCPNCDSLFVKNNFREVCDSCYKEEEAKFDKVYQFIRKRDNRTATMKQVVAATEVEETLIIRFIKSGRLRIAQFPNLGIPCEKCGKAIHEGKLCTDCIKSLRSDIYKHEKEENRQREIEERSKKSTYYTK